MRIKFVHGLCFMFLLSLTACGEGWEMKLTDEITPYGNSRTAGSGVAYVLAKMMPEKKLILEPVSRPRTVPVLQQEKVQQLESEVREKQMK